MPALRNNNWETACRNYVLKGGTKVASYKIGFPNANNYKPNVAQVKACEFFKRPKIIARVAELHAEKAAVAKKEFAADAAYVLRRLVEIDRMDVLDILEDDGSLKPVRDWPVIWRQFISQFEVDEIFAGKGDERLQIGLLKKIKWPDKVRNLELLGRHVDVSAFKDIKELVGPGGGPVQLIKKEMTAEEAAEAYAGTLNDR